MRSEVHHHTEEVCEPGLGLYAHAPREGRVPRAEAGHTPCLLVARLLRPDRDDAGLPAPVPPAVGLHRALRPPTDRVADERRHTARLVETFEPLLRLAPGPGAGPATSAISALSGPDRINDASTSGGHPAALRYVASTFERLRNLATPMYPEAVRRPTQNGIAPAGGPSPPSSSRATRTPSSPTASA